VACAVITLVGMPLACNLSGIPANVRRYMDERAKRYPWVREPVDEEHKARLCAALGLDGSSPLCRPDSRVSVSDVVLAVQRRFPLNKTRYEEVAEALKGFPVAVEESRLPSGEVTSRRYAYHLTQFKGFCVYFYVDLETGIVDRIHNTKEPGIFD
jgi:hypothetical protein